MRTHTMPLTSPLQSNTRRIELPSAGYDCNEHRDDPQQRKRGPHERHHAEQHGHDAAERDYPPRLPQQLVHEKSVSDVSYLSTRPIRRRT
jgi:hypothetical protein